MGMGSNAQSFQRELEQFSSCRPIAVGGKGATLKTRKELNAGLSTGGRFISTMYPL